ncbi:MAG: sugar phosphate isomerase/epimerase [Chloroflexi bacterium]|nr:sugar phosphate isomerase/epimerase [Chloroflexota bacterium]
MQIGMNLWTVYGWQLATRPDEHVLGALAEMGMRAVELVVDEGPNSVENLLAHRAEIQALLRKYGMVVPSVASALFWRYNLGSKEASVRQHAIEIIEGMAQVAKAYGAGVILIVAGQQEAHTPFAQTWNHAVASIQQAAQVAEQLAVQIGVENVGSNFLDSPGEMAQFLADVNRPNVGSYLDLGNAMSVLNGYPENWCTALAGKIVCVHVKDYDRQSHQTVNCGQGQLPWGEVLPVLKQCGYDGYLFIETPPEPAGGVEAGLAAARESLAGMKPFAPL